MEITDPILIPYLAADKWIETDHPLIRAKAEQLESIPAAYLFVRDNISHSWDIQAAEVTASASEVLTAGHGICYAKSHLLAALLRAMGVPSGIAYQKLTLFDDPAEGYSIHALNTVYLADQKRWIRLDARGNKPGVQAEYSEDQECLAFPVRAECGEIDYTENFASPHPAIIAALAQGGDIRELYRNHLPTELSGVGSGVTC